MSISLEEKEGINQQEELNNIATSFCKIFDAVYGEKTWSVRRMVYSVLLSTLFVIFSILIIGVENSYIYRYINSILIVTLIFWPCNFIIDFISLVETRWVMESVSKKQWKIPLAAWIGIDLALTAGIYFILISAFLLIYTMIPMIFTLPSDSSIGADTGEHKTQYLSLIQFWGTLLAPSKAMPFFISTFATSIVWYVYVIVAVIVMRSSQASAFMAVAWRSTFESKAPGRVIGLVVGVLLMAVFAMVKLISWLYVIATT